MYTEQVRPNFPLSEREMEREEGSYENIENTNGNNVVQFEHVDSMCCERWRFYGRYTVRRRRGRGR